MAKIFKNLQLANLDGKIRKTKIEIKKQRLVEEYRVEKAVDSKIKAANKTLKKLLISSMSGEEIFDIKAQKEIKKYDVKNHWQYRKTNHACMKEIFANAENNEKIAEILAQNAEEVTEIKQQRAEFIEKLKLKKEKYVNSHKVEQSQLDKQKEEFDQKLDACEKEIEELYVQKNNIAKENVAKNDAELEEKLSKLVEKKKEMLSNEYDELPPDTVLRIDGLCMYFGGLHAVEELSLEVKKGEVFGLIGPNGAGKTTVFNCITQFYKPTKGEMLFVNKENTTVKLTDFAVHDIILEGISRTFQNVEVIKEVSVLDNLLIAATRFYTSNLFEQALHLPILKIEEENIKKKALKILDMLGLSTYKDWYAYGLPYGILKKIEIARALMAEPKLIILDEPAAGLNDSETKDLAELIKKIRKDFDCTILLVEHDMSLVMSVCDRICAISFGKKIALGTPEEIQADKQVQEAYLGVSE